MWFEIRNNLIIHEPTQEIHKLCQKHLVVDNPEYVKKERMGLWTGSTPRKLYLYEADADRLILPTGCTRGMHRRFPDARWEDYRVKGEAFAYGSEIALYGYQEEAVKAALDAGGGIIVAFCGSGKTQVGLELVARLGVKTLWLTHTADLLNQSMARAQACFSCGSGYGKITEGKVQIGEGLTFATVQTMAKLDMPMYTNEWGCVVVDECHHCIGTPTKVMQFYRVLSWLGARYKFGLTATPHRADGMETAMFALLGGICHEVPREAVRDTTCPVRVRVVDTGWLPGDAAFMGDGTIDYHGLVDDLTMDTGRMRLVSDTIAGLPKGEPVLVLGCRVAYLEEMEDKVSKRGRKCLCISGMGKTKKAKAERKEALEMLGRCEIDCLFATYQLAKEGLDCPNLRHVVFATPEKDPTTVQQAAGRVGRKAEGKEYGTVWDFVDAFGTYQGWAKKRKGIYKKLGYEYQSSGKED